MHKVNKMKWYHFSSSNWFICFYFSHYPLAILPISSALPTSFRWHSPNILLMSWVSHLKIQYLRLSLQFFLHKLILVKQAGYDGVTVRASDWLSGGSSPSAGDFSSNPRGILTQPNPASRHGTSLQCVSLSMVWQYAHTDTQMSSRCPTDVLQMSSRCPPDVLQMSSRCPG